MNLDKWLLSSAKKKKRLDFSEAGTENEVIETSNSLETPSTSKTDNSDGNFVFKF